MACRDEFEELLFYVVELKDKLNAKLDEQCAKINQQAAIVNQQGQIIDELCWQLRELSEKTRELRAENRVLRGRVDAFGSGHCQCQEGDAGTYQNHVVERYNELVEGGGGRKIGKVKPEPKVVEYAQVDKVTPRRWPFGGNNQKSTTLNVSEPELNATTSGNTTWYLDVESIYEPIQLSAKPSTAAKLEQISAQVSTSLVVVPKPAPRRLYPTKAMENLAEYFGEIGSRNTVTLGDSVADAVLLREEGRFGGRFGALEERTERQLEDGKVVACSRLENLDKISLPSEQYLTADNLVRFSFNSRPATMAPTAADKSTVDHRRHAIRSYI
ncbi:uncharacterized protein LOC6051036 [Culex quinquefasciatus]|uniref:uncharacterized protein LOC6051036 n=1 Tax=Culex quinquefasciatus TaxID=7176 RepID=UPI0018E30778|nr:uncharacterized protein LOC6051036 [Culex quinquefasciatus]